MAIDIEVEIGYSKLFPLIFPPHLDDPALQNFMRISLLTHFVMFSRVPGLTSLPLSCYQFFFSWPSFQITDFSSGKRHQNKTLAKDNIKQFI